MTSRVILGKGMETKKHEIRINIKGKGGEKGIQMIENLTNHIEYLKCLDTQKAIDDQCSVIVGYCRACVDAGFMDSEGADELMQLTAILASVEIERIKKGNNQ